MLRITSTRPLSGGLLKALPRPGSNVTKSFSILATQSRYLSKRRPNALITLPIRPLSTSIARYATNKGPPYDKIDLKHEMEVAGTSIEPHPKDVSQNSSVRQVFEGSTAENEADMLGGIKQDLVTIKETFSLHDVPKESLYIGAAGVLPYLATSLSTVYLAYDINHGKATGSHLLFSAETAHDLLAIIEPIQIGYGAVIISFLGAIHWGLEYAGYGGRHSYSRYAFGVVAPAVAWPTMLMPVEYALITQFLAFNFLYFADARATVRGWCPPWYSTYRFVLTFIVGASIVLSLIGRGQIAARDHNIKSPVAGMQALRDSQWENLEREEKERRRKLAAEEEAAQEEDEDEEAEDSDGEEKSDDEGDEEEDSK